MILLSIHPVIQLLAFSLAIYAAYLGFSRIRSLHFGQKTKFNRERHVYLGSLAIFAFMGGMAGGLIMVTFYLHKSPLASQHGKLAMIMIPFLLAGLITGYFLYQKPKMRKLLPALHGLNNLVLLLLAILQIYTGYYIYQFLVLAK